MTKNAKSIMLDGETADQITRLNLNKHRAYLKKAVRDFKKGQYLHPQDLADNVRLIESLDCLISYFGGE